MTDQGLPPVGVRLIADGEAPFQSAINNSIAAINALTTAAQKAAAQFAAPAGYTAAAQKAIPATQQTGQAAQAAGTAMSGMGVAAMALSVATGTVLANAVQYATGQIQMGVKQLEAYGKMAIETAGRFDQMTLVANLMGTTQGYTAEQIGQQIEAIRDQGVEAEVATNVIVSLARSQIDLSKSVELAKVAQDAAVISNSNSSETLQRLNWGIDTLNTQMLRYAGIIVDSDAAMTKYAEEHNTTASALTVTERKQAMLNAVIEEGTKIQGAYAISMESGYKISKSMERVLNDISIAIGGPFQQAYFNVEKTFYETARGMAAVFEKGGALYPVLEKLGAVASVVAEGFRDFTMGLLGTVDATGKLTTANGPLMQWLTDLANSMIDTAEKAFTWGANIVGQLAQGIIDGASVVLTAAMDFVAGMLTYFLAPGSPPKVAPQIDKWGLAAITEYLEGFTQADFGMLKEIQQPLQNVLSTILGSAGGTKAFASLTPDLIRAVSAGSVDEGLIARIGNLTSAYGTEVAELVRKQLELNAASKAVYEIETKIKALREKETEQANKLNTMYEEYNDLVASGADAATLKLKREEIKAAEKGLKATVKERTAQEKAYSEAQAKLDPLREQIQLQSQLIDQLNQMAKAQQQAEKAGGGGGAKAPKPTDMGKPDLESSKKKIDEAFEQLKESIREKMSTALKPLTDAWDDFTKNHLPQLQTSWDNMTKSVSDAWNKWVQPVIDSIKGFIPPDMLQQIGWVTGAIVGLGVVIGALAIPFLAISAIVSTSWFPIVAAVAGVIAAIAFLKSAWENDLGGIRTALTNFWNNSVKPTFEGIKEWFQVAIPKAIEFFKNAWASIKVAVQWVTTAFVNFKLFLDGVWAGINTAVQWVVGVFNTFAQFINTSVIPVFQAVWNFIQLNIIPVFQGIANVISSVVLAAFSALSMFYQNTLLPIFQAVWGFISEHIIPLFQALADLIQAVVINVIQSLIAKIREKIAVFYQVASVIRGFVITVIEALVGQIKKNIEVLVQIGKVITEIFLAAYAKFVNFMTEKVHPIVEKFVEFLKKLSDGFGKVAETVEQRLAPVFEWFREKIINPIIGAFDKLGGVIDTITGGIKALADKLKGVKTPPMLTPGSPTPFEMGLRGIRKQMNALTKMDLPALKKEFSLVTPPASAQTIQGRSGNTYSNSNTYTLGGVYTTQSQQGIVQALEILETLAAK